LKSKNETPERYGALEKIVDYLKRENIKDLIIAGDLFDKDFNNYSDFENICRTNQEINFYIILGNHDTGLEQRHFSSPNIEIFREITIKKFENIQCLFLPYQMSGTMDEILINYFNNHEISDRLVLISHGDYINVNKSINEYEKGYYMPLSNNIINDLKPLLVFLGHIHKANNNDIVYYPGSPYPLDINETGKRKFLIYDTNNYKPEYVYLDLDRINMVEELLIIPNETEIEDAINKLDEIINNWNLNDSELEKVVLRLILKGFTNDKNALVQNITHHLDNKKIKLYDNNVPLDNKLNIVKDANREFLMNDVLNRINNLTETFDYSEKEDIIEQALNLIFND
jgi:DNA repair exonuclease SbcCD nuclease subunit